MSGLPGRGQQRLFSGWNALCWALRWAGKTEPQREELLRLAVRHGAYECRMLQVATMDIQFASINGPQQFTDSFNGGTTRLRNVVSELLDVVPTDVSVEWVSGRDGMPTWPLMARIQILPQIVEEGAEDAA